MIILLIVLLVILWILGFLPFYFFQIPLFSLNGQEITIYELLVFGVILWACGILPSPFRQIAIVLVILWVVATLGFITIANFSNIVILAFIVGLIIFAFRGFTTHNLDD